ncbi:MAG: type II toxin-antitoxin system VapC family toxin [Acidimicrobiales bacterium]
MNLLLDTHALLWWMNGDPLSGAAIAAIADPRTPVFVSAAAAWEIAIKSALGKLSMERSVAESLTDEGFDPLSISVAHAERAGALPPHHRDPFDRMMVAQAQIERLTIVTRDPVFSTYDVDVLAC